MGLRVRWVRKGAVLVLALACVWLAVSALAAWRLTRRQKPRFVEGAPTLPASSPRTLRIQTRDGLELGAWYLEHPRARICLVLLHGQGGSRAQWTPLLPWLATQEFSSLIPSLRAHGDSAGERNDFGWSSRLDVLATVDWIESHQAGAAIVVAGSSLGAAAAIFAAEDLGRRVAGYLLESPYIDLRRAMEHRLDIYLAPPFDFVAGCGLTLCAPLFLDFDPKLESPWQRVRDIPPELPVTFLAGSLDRRAPASEVRELCLRTGGRARLVLFEGADHGGLLARDPERYRTALVELCSEASSSPAR